MQTDDYRNLHGYAVKLLMAMIDQYRGKNNGNLTAAYRAMNSWGFKSKGTLAHALKALLDADLIIKTREGKFRNPGSMCALYALTWHRIDECDGKHDMKPGITAPRKISMEKLKARSENSTKVDSVSVPTSSKITSINR